MNVSMCLPAFVGVSDSLTESFRLSENLTDFVSVSLLV